MKRHQGLRKVLGVCSAALLALLLLFAVVLLVLAYTDRGGSVADTVPADADLVFYTPRASALLLDVLSSPLFLKLRASSVWPSLVEEAPSLKDLSSLLPEKGNLSSWRRLLLNAFLRSPLCAASNREGVMVALRLRPLPKALCRLAQALRSVTGFSPWENEDGGLSVRREGDVLLLAVNEDASPSVPESPSSHWRERILEGHEFLWVGPRLLHGISLLRPIESLECRLDEGTFAVRAPLREAYRKRAGQILSGHTDALGSLEGDAMRVRWNGVSTRLLVAFLDRSLHENLPIETWFSWLFGEKAWEELLCSFQGNGEIQLDLSSRREPPAAEGAVLMGAVEDHRLEEVAAKALLRLQEISPFPFVAEQEQAAISVYPLVSLPVKRASIETERTELRVFLGEKRSPVPPLPAGREEGPCVSLAVDPSMASDLLAFFPLLREDYGRIAECLALLPSFRANLHLEEDRLLLRLNRLSNGPGSHRNGPLDSQRNAPQPDDALTSLDTSP